MLAITSFCFERTTTRADPAPRLRTSDTAPAPRSSHVSPPPCGRMANKRPRLVNTSSSPSSMPRASGANSTCPCAAPPGVPDMI
jgi:hypothetical protein